MNNCLNVICENCGKTMVLSQYDLECYNEETYVFYDGQYFCCEQCIIDHYNE